MSQKLIGHIGHIPNGSSHLKTFIMLGIMEAMKSPGGRDLVLGGHDPANEIFLYDAERGRPGPPLACIDEQGPWPPVPVDPVVAKHARLRIDKAQAKRERKNRKRLKAAGRV